MRERRVWNWTFLGFKTAQGNRLVQDWFDGLPEAAQDDAKDILTYLQHAPIIEWRRPKFAQLEDGISEIRFDDDDKTYRIYGAFWPARQSYTFLHGREKKVKNDTHGKATAKDNLAKLRRREADVHKFEFERRIDQETSEGQGGPPTIRFFPCG